ncbi:MAG: gamma carbonic anhydrase family protein [Deltaproteobacteria bacterium]|nr:gamma carbonic anhydrase family protein [Deltaproteobacteria bacterium]
MARLIEYKGKKPEIGKDVFIAEGAFIIGDVVIGDDSNVWFNTVIRGDMNSIRIGSQCSIQDLVLIHVSRQGPPVIIGDRVTIGHKATIHGAKIENDVLIGMNATLLDGTEIGEYSVVAAGAVLTENTKIPPYSLVVGVPAKIKKTFTREEVKRFEYFHKHYLELKEDYLIMNKEK